MSIWKCPHCGTTPIVVGGEPISERCIKAGCGAIMIRQEDDKDAAAAVSAALLAHDHTANIPPVRAVRS